MKSKIYNHSCNTEQFWIKEGSANALLHPPHHPDNAFVENASGKVI